MKDTSKDFNLEVKTYCCIAKSGILAQPMICSYNAISWSRKEIMLNKGYCWLVQWTVKI